MSGMSKSSKAACLAMRWQADVGDHVIALAWSPDGSAGARGRRSHHALRRAKRTHQARPPRSRLRHDRSVVESARTLLASSGQDGKVRIWNAHNGKLHTTLDGGAAWVERVAWSPDGNVAGLGGRREGAAVEHGRAIGPRVSATIRAPWPTSNGSPERWNWRPPPMANSPCGSRQGRAAKGLKWKGSMLVLAWSPDGKYIATGDQDSTVHFWTTKTGEDLMMSGYPMKVRELSWDCTSRYLATGGGGRASGMCQARDRPAQSLSSLRRTKQSDGPGLSTRGTVSRFGGRDGLVGSGSLANTSGGTPNRVGDHPVVWSPDDHRLALGTESGIVAVYALK